MDIFAQSFFLTMLFCLAIGFKAGLKVIPISHKIWLWSGILIGLNHSLMAPIVAMSVVGSFTGWVVFCTFIKIFDVESGRKKQDPYQYQYSQTEKPKRTLTLGSDGELEEIEVPEEEYLYFA